MNSTDFTSMLDRLATTPEVLKIEIRHPTFEIDPDLVRDEWEIVVWFKKQGAKSGYMTGSASTFSAAILDLFNRLGRSEGWEDFRVD